MSQGMPVYRTAARHRRRGSYAALFAFLLVVLLAFGALAIDVSYIRLAQTQTQDVADASSQAALYALRRTGDLQEARDAAAAVAAQNRVVGHAPTIEDVTFGTWDEQATTPSFVEDEDQPNAVRVQAARVDDNAVPFFLARLFGFQEADIRRDATSAARALHVVLVMDITGSWSQANFRNARNAAIAFLDTLETSFGEYDKVGMVIFTGRYAWEYTPLRYISDEVNDHVARTAWERLNVASKGGTARTFPQECNLKADSPSGRNSARNVFTSPTGGCYPYMPREYTDEPGTDHTTGLTMARTMFSEQTDPTAFRAQVVLTDGIPNGLAAANGTYRTQLGYTETRWREFRGPVPHTTSVIKTQSNTMTEEMYTNLGVNTWVVSFVQDDSFMHTMPKGLGYFTLTSSSAALVPIFEDIANSLPMAIVE